MKFSTFSHCGGLETVPETERAEIEKALRSLRCSSRLAGIRGKLGVDLHMLAACLDALCKTYQRETNIVEIEINPLAVIAPDRFVALDALVSIPSADEHQRIA